MPESIEWRGIRRVADVFSSLLSPFPSLLSSEAGRHSPISRRSVVRIARVWRCIPEEAEHSVGDLRGIFRSHVFHPVRMVSGAAASVPTRFVEQRHHLHRQAAGEVAGRAHPRSYRPYRYATRSRSNRRRHVGGMAEVRALLVRAARNGGIVDPIFGRSLHFYLFQLPGWQLITGWPLTLAVTLVGLPSSLF